jgi:cobalt-zinc-cadmium efflux system membrane fusion protein
MAVAHSAPLTGMLQKVSRRTLIASALGLVLLLGVLYATRHRWSPSNASEPASAAKAAQTKQAGKSADQNLVRLPEEKWSAAGVRIEPVALGDLSDSLWVTGKLAFNEDRMAHIYPLVEGVVREVTVRFGQEVKANQVLATIASKEVGTTKLELVKNRLALSFAKVNYQWTETIAKNTKSLIAALKEGIPPLEIEEKFRDQAMGDYRQQLVTAYSRLHQTRADYARLKGLWDQKMAIEREYIRSKADLESAEATYHATVDQARFTSQQQLLAAGQKIQEAETAVSVSQSHLMILGFRKEEIDAMNPIAEGGGVANYPIKAPFDGTVIQKDIVLSEYVGPQMQLFQIADPSTIWIQADVFEKDVAALQDLAGKKIKFRANSYPGREFTADVFSTGGSVDEKTRAVRLLAVATNPDRILKPGMFVEVGLPKESIGKVLQIPASAIQQYDNHTFVFVHRGGDEFQRREITTGRTVNDRIEITNGLSEGERVAVDGGFALKSELLRELMAGD